MQMTMMIWTLLFVHHRSTFLSSFENREYSVAMSDSTGDGSSDLHNAVVHPQLRDPGGRQVTQPPLPAMEHPSDDCTQPAAGGDIYMKSPQEFERQERSLEPIFSRTHRSHPRRSNRPGIPRTLKTQEARVFPEWEVDQSWSTEFPGIPLPQQQLDQSQETQRDVLWFDLLALPAMGLADPEQKATEMDTSADVASSGLSQPIDMLSLDEQDTLLSRVGPAKVSDTLRSVRGAGVKKRSQKAKRRKTGRLQ
jgi:hypothetical protein